MVMGRHALVWGMARSGVAAAMLLDDAGARVRVNDIKTEAELGDALTALEGRNIERMLGVPVEQALEGIDLIIMSPGIPVTHPAVKLARDKGIEVIGEIELAYRMGQGRVIGVTGTNGKTTTVTLLGEIFKNAGRITHVVGNIGAPYSAAAAKMKKTDIVVCELSSFQLETVDKLHPEITAILNLTEDHLNRHGTMEAYGELKKRAFMNQAGEDWVVLNYDDPLTRAMASDVKCRVRWFSRTQIPPSGAFLRDGFLVFGDEASAVNVCLASDVYIPGPHNMENALAALAVALCAGVPAPVVRHTLRTFKGVEHRLETVRTLSGVKYINDSKATNPDSAMKAIETMTAPTVILLGGSEKDSDYAPMCRLIKHSNIIYAVLIGETGEKIARALDAAGFRSHEYAGDDFERAIFAARKHAPSGGCVLLSPACASFGMFSDYEQRGREFKRIVLALPDTPA